jgi:hypothetical protein
MIPLGYLYKRTVSCPDWLHMQQVQEMVALAGCITSTFCDYIPFWRHNGWWLFDSPDIMNELARERGIDLSGMTLFYYEAFPEQYDEEQSAWRTFGPERSFVTQVEPPSQATLLGFDVVTFSMQNMPEHSPLSCNGLAQEIPVNQFALLESLDAAQNALNQGRFRNSEPGPYRIISIHRVASLAGG